MDCDPIMCVADENYCSKHYVRINKSALTSLRARVAALEEENGRLREQLRLANIDAANTIADINSLRSVVKEQEYKLRRRAGKEEL